MPVYTIARFEVHAEAREQAERAMHEFAMYVRKELPDSVWTTYRDPQAPTRYLSVIRAENPAADERYRKAPGTQQLANQLHPLIVGRLEVAQYELVTSSDLAPRHKPGRRG